MWRLIFVVIVVGGSSCNLLTGNSTGADTTSSNFTFQTYTFGGNAGSCVLSDVAIISDTDIWAVGAVYLDSADGNPDPYAYNAVQWDGASWQLTRIYFSTVCGQSDMTPYPATAILALSDTDIWIAGAGQVVRFNGHSQSAPMCVGSPMPFVINRLWGSSINSVYAVGYGGNIVHYANGTWTNINSGTTLTFNDIYGSGGQILAVCSQNYPAGQGIYSINGNTAARLSTRPIDPIEEFFSVWFVPNQQYYVIGDGIYQKNSLSDSTWRNGPLDITHYGTTSVRGNGTKDVFVVGAFGEFLHWNGVRWKSFIDQTGLANGSYTRVATRGNLAVAVGGNNNQAVITVAKRQ